MKNTPLAIDYFDQRTNHEFHIPLSAFKRPQNESEYKVLEKILDELIDEIRDDESHPLADAMQIIGDNLEQYDDAHAPAIGANLSEVDIVKYIMKAYNLRQKDLAPIFGGQANVSKFLNGERALSKFQIAGLKKQFDISADLFI